MTLTIELSPEQPDRLDELAARLGVDPAEFAHRAVVDAVERPVAVDGDELQSVQELVFGSGLESLRENDELLRRLT